jgi:hypothetical protein
VVGLANGQSPTEPILRRREGIKPPAASGHPQYAVRPEGRRLRGGRNELGTLRQRWHEAYKPPKEPRRTSLQDKVRLSPQGRLRLLLPCFQGGRASRRTGTGAVPAVTPFYRRRSRPADAFASAPSHIPSDRLLAGSTPRRLPGPLSNFRKIHLYGKTKKSTHGHTTAAPNGPHDPPRLQMVNKGRRNKLAHFPEPPDPSAARSRVGRVQGSRTSTRPHTTSAHPSIAFHPWPRS